MLQSNICLIVITRSLAACHNDLHLFGEDDHRRAATG